MYELYIGSDEPLGYAPGALAIVMPAPDGAPFANFMLLNTPNVRDPPEPSVAGTELYPVRPAAGACEVVLYSPDHNSELAQMPLRKIDTDQPSNAETNQRSTRNCFGCFFITKMRRHEEAKARQRTTKTGRLS